jgi:hypothetical protein
MRMPQYQGRLDSVDAGTKIAFLSQWHTEKTLHASDFVTLTASKL